MQTITEHLRARCKQYLQGHSYRDLAKLASVDVSVAHKFVAGRAPQSDTVDRLAAAFGLRLAPSKRSPPK